MPKNWNLLLLAVFLILFPLAHCVDPIPTKPRNLTKSDASSTTISLQWVKPAKRSQYTTSYLITYNEEEVETNSTSREYTLTGLQPFTTYNISVAAMNAGGVGNKSTTITVETAEAVPAEPLSLNSTSTNTSVTLTWSQPEHPNGVITSYVITYSEELINTSGDTLSYTLTGLLPFTTYTISVAARNGAGIGNKSQEAMETTKKGYPSAPKNLKVTQKTCNYAKISWKAPQVVGDMPDTVKYIVDISEEAELKNTFSEMTSSQNYTAHNLTAETTYKVTVRAQNSIALGQLAMVTFNTQPYDLKTITSKKLTNSSVKIKVTSSQSEVYECLAEAQGSDLSQTDRKPSQTNKAGAANFADLESNTTYNIICTEKSNNCQRGTVSFTTHSVPSQPTDVIVQVVTCNSAMITWSPPFHDGGSPVQEYQVQVKEGPHIVQSILTANESLFVLNIEVDTSYMVSIGSINSIGIGPFAMITFSTKSYDNAGIMTTSPSNTKIEVNIGTPQTYACSATEVDTGDSSTNNSTSTDGIGIFQELKSNTKYSINCTGLDNTCIIASTTATTIIGAPDPPTIAMSPTTTCQSIQLSWTPPTNIGGDEISSYNVTYYMSGAEESKQKQMAIITNQTSVTLRELVPNTEYTVLVRASNSKQTGEAANITVTTNSTEKGDIIAKPKSTSATLLHSLGNDVYYRCSTTGTSTDQFNITAGDGYTLISGLSADTTYTVNCVAYKDDVEYCLEATNTFKTLPATVTMLKTTGVAIHGDPEITQPIAWKRPSNHTSKLEYVITYSIKGGSNTVTVVPKTDQTSINISLPTPKRGIAYIVSVAAESDVGQGEALEIDIQYKRPNLLDNIQSHNITCNSITVTWKAPEDTGGLELLRYRIEESQTEFSKEVGPKEVRTIVIPNLLQNTEYGIRVRAANSIGVRAELATVIATTKAKDAADITATSPSNTKIELNIMPAQTYACSARDVDIEEYTHINTSNDGIGIFQELKSNTNYSINCTGLDNACIIASTTATTRIGVPDPPTIARKPGATCHSINISWTAPINTGGDDISNYTVTYYISVPGKSEKIHTANILAITLNGLAPNTEYTVLVTASNSQQTGEADNITVRTQSRGNGDIMVSNTDSTSATLLHSLGNDAYYRCNITGASTDQFKIPAVEGFNLSGLSADTTYIINCVAYKGDMEYCYEAYATFKTSPAAVTMLWTTGVAFHGNPNITQPIAWERPPQHTSTLTYVITFLKTKESNTATVLKTDQTSINASLPIPTKPTTYTVSVAAKSDVGLGEAVERKISYNKSTNPGNIQTHNITCNSITVTWEAPVNTGGLELLEYRIQEIKSGFSTDAGPNENGPIVIPNLLQNTSYKIRVRAINSIGVSSTPVPASTATKGSIELNIIPVSATRMTVQITTPIDGADYSCTLSSQGHNQSTVNTSTTNATFSNLQTNTNYTVACLVYENRQELCHEGNGMGKTFPEVPDEPPANVTVLETVSTAFTAAWRVPEGYEYNEDITGYNVVYWTAGSPNMTNMTANTTYTYTATGLTTDRVYYFIVAAMTAKGTGAYSKPIQPATIPIIEKLSFINVTTDSFSIRWEGNYTGYSIHIRIEVVDEFGQKTEINQTELSGDSTDFRVKGLASFRQYQINLHLTKPDETGTGSTVRKNVTTHAKKPEGKPKDTNTTSGARNVTLQWKIPSSAKRNGIITSYRIEWKSLGTVQAQKSPVIRNLTNPSFTHPADISYTLTSLTPYTNYKWRVAAVNDKGDGPFSEYHNFTTEEDAPGIVGTITYSPYNSSSGEVKWSKPTAPNGLITTYELCYWKLGTKCDSPSNTTNSTASQEYLNNFTPGVPHVVSVTAFTSAGRGAYSTIQMPFFSQELKPNTTVQNITVNRINSTTANISWIPLTLHEARGYPEYTVQIISGGVTEFEKNTTESSILANDLEARKVYTAQVQPVTAGGREGGPVSAVNFGRAPDEMEHDGIVIAIVIVLIILVALICIILIVIIVVFCKYKKNKGELLYDNEEMVPLKELVDESMVARQNMKKNNAIPKQQFSAHVRKMHLRKDSEFKEEFSDITREPPVGHEAAEANRTKNRYINIYPYDYSRVVLNKLDGSDYINAAFIDGYHGERRYIASQGPTPATVADFWEMVWEQQSTVIVMLTKLVEGTRVKCEQYWREDLNQPYEPGRDIRVTTTSHRVMTGFEARNITLEKTSEKSSPLKVKHFLYTAWPDHGVPQYSSSMVKFIQEQIRPEIQNSSSPIIVHCSAGAGRTGTLIAIDTAIDRLEEEEDINIFERVEFMRARRTQMVQNVNQYMYIHDAINDYVTCGNTTIVAHDLGKKIKVLNKTHPTTKMRGYDRQFQKLVDTSPEIDQTDLDFSQGADIAELNRYPDKIPYSDTEKHILTEDAEKYVNATEVKGYYGQNTFIAAQAPMKNTAEDIWNVIRERKCSVVVVLTNFRENEQEMCAEFWPSEVGVPMEIGYMKISLIQTDSSENFNKHNLSISVEEADILHKVEIYHYLSWVKDGCPNIPSLLKLMGEVQRSQQGDSEPVFVMCDDGMSRTGVFITVMSEIDRVKLEGEMDIFQTIKAARTARPYMVSTVKDFEYCHEIMQQYLESFDTYANFK